MPDQRVPWAVGRRALVRTEWGWREGFGRKSRGAEPDFWIVPEDRADGTTWERRIAVAGRATALLPHQCPRCFEVGTHADGCMVAANLAREVPAFWAPWAMWTHPAPGCEYVRLYRIVGDETVSETVTVMKWKTEDRSLFFVALGPDGPTLAPWGLA